MAENLPRTMPAIHLPGRRNLPGNLSSALAHPYTCAAIGLQDVTLPAKTRHSCWRPGGNRRAPGTAPPPRNCAASARSRMSGSSRHAPALRAVRAPGRAATGSAAASPPPALCSVELLSLSLQRPVRHVRYSSPQNFLSVSHRNTA